MRPHHIFIIAMLLLSGCAQDEIRIGYIGALTGEVASAGIPNMRGVELAVDEINRGGGIDGRTLRFSVEDDQLTDRLAIAAYHKFRDSEADAILSMS